VNSNKIMKIRDMTPNERELHLAADSAHDKKLTLRYIMDGGSRLAIRATHIHSPANGTRGVARSTSRRWTSWRAKTPMRHDGTAVYLLTAGGRKLLEEFRA